MTFQDIFKSSFLKSFDTGDLSLRFILLSLVFACVGAAYIFFVYRLITRKTFYNKNFNISLAANTLIVTAIILAIQSSIVLSLGMVGALSIVRFRTAVKDPLDLTFLFWSISVGIICGAGLYGIAVITSVLLTAGILVLNALPVARVPLLLVINAADAGAKAAILEAVQQHTKAYHIKSQVIEQGRLDLILEVRTADMNGLIDAVAAQEHITRCSLISHDGEVTF